MKKLILFTLIFVYVFSFSIIAQNKEKNTKETMVLIKTEFGNMKIKLYNETPLHRDNFIKLVKEEFYNDLLFHRIIKGFMIQGGDPDSRNAAPNGMLGSGGTGYTVLAEFNVNLYHKKGVLAAARMGDEVNPKKESSGCQFYIVQGRKYSETDLKEVGRRIGKEYSEEQIKTYSTIGGTPQLDGNYTVFGEVIEGLEVIDIIANVKTNKYDRPLQDVKMTIVIL